MGCQEGRGSRSRGEWLLEYPGREGRGNLMGEKGLQGGSLGKQSSPKRTKNSAEPGGKELAEGVPWKGAKVKFSYVY